MNSTAVVKETKAALLNSYFLSKAEMTLKYRYNEEESEYPTQFWDVKLSTQIENQSEWEEILHCHCDSLPESIARLVLNQDSDKLDYYEECEMPSRLKSWKSYRITVKENISRKKKWGELRESRHASIVYEIKLNNGEWVEDFSESARDLEIGLCFVPKRFWNMSEGFVPYEWDYHNNENQTPSDYPFFEYKGHLFKTTHWFPGQKCVCGTSPDYVNEYENDNSIKVEVWNAKVYEKNIIYLDSGRIIFNGEVTLATEVPVKLDWIDEKGKEKLKEIFPESKGFNSWSESCSWR